MTRIYSVKCRSEKAVSWAQEMLVCAGLQVSISFDLQLARETHTECSCPHHGTAECDCQMVVFLVYGQDACPASLIIHGRDGLTYLTLADTPGQRPSANLVAAIFSALAPNSGSRQRQIRAIA